MPESSRSAHMLIGILICASVFNICSSAPTDDRVAKEYIVENILPEYPLLGAKLLTLPSRVRSALIPYLQPPLHNEADSSQLELNEVIDALRPSQKRGLGQCIHNCINGRGNMNFIQCKSMCH